MTCLSMGIKLRVFLSCTVLMVSFFIHISAFAAAALVPLGSFWPNSPDGGGVALGLSDDGTVAVGWSVKQTTTDDVAFRWDEITGIESLEYLPGQAPAHNVSNAEVISGDGLTIFGRSSSDSEGLKFIWTSGSGMQLLDIGDNTLKAASFDGSVQAGQTNGALGEAFRRSGGVITQIGSLTTNPSRLKSSAAAISSDGSVVVGWSNSDVGAAIRKEAFRWTETGGMVGLGFLPSEGFVEGAATAVSSSGDIVAGSVRVFEGGKSVSHGFMWQQESGMQSFYASPDSGILVEVTDISADGKVIIGQLRLENGLGQGFRYSEAGGFQTVEQWLTDAGVDLHGWSIRGVSAVSADGKTLAGYIENATWYQPYIAYVISDDIFVDGFE